MDGCVASTLHPLQEAEPETAGKMQDLALAEGALPRHFHTALFTASTDNRMLTHRQLSRHLIGLWVTGNPTANALLRRMLVGGGAFWWGWGLLVGDGACWWGWGLLVGVGPAGGGGVCWWEVGPAGGGGVCWWGWGLLVGVGLAVVVTSSIARGLLSLAAAARSGPVSGLRGASSRHSRLHAHQRQPQGCAGQWVGWWVGQMGVVVGGTDGRGDGKLSSTFPLHQSPV